MHGTIKFEKPPSKPPYNGLYTNDLYASMIYHDIFDEMKIQMGVSLNATSLPSRRACRVPRGSSSSPARQGRQGWC